MVRNSFACSLSTPHSQAQSLSSSTVSLSGGLCLSGVNPTTNVSLSFMESISSATKRESLRGAPLWASCKHNSLLLPNASTTILPVTQTVSSFFKPEPSLVSPTFQSKLTFFDQLGVFSVHLLLMPKSNQIAAGFDELGFRQLQELTFYQI